MNTIIKSGFLITLFVLFSISVNAVPITWDNILNMDISGGGTNYEKTTINGWGNGGMGSANQLQPGQDGSVQWTMLNAALGVSFALGLSDSDVDYHFNTNDYAFSIFNFNGTAGTDIIVHGVVVASAGGIQAGDVFKIERQSSTVIFYKNNVVVFNTTTDSSLPMVVDAAVFATGEGGMSIDIDASFSILIPDPDENIYTILKKELDGSYVRAIGGKLFFRQREDYKIVTGENDQPTYKIYDWTQQQVLTSGFLPNTYGVNWFSLSTGLPYDIFYILEVTGLNKDELLYLRFKPECPPGQVCD